MKYAMTTMLACLLFASAAEAGHVGYEFSGTLDDGTTEFSGWMRLLDPFPSDEAPSADFGMYTDDSNSFLEWSVEIGGTTFAPDPSEFRVDEVYVLDGTPVSDKILLFSSDSYAFSILFTNDDGTAFTGDALPSDLDEIGWDSMRFGLEDWPNGKKYSGSIEVLNSAPLPSAAWMGLGLLGGLAALRRMRRNRKYIA